MLLWWRTRMRKIDFVNHILSHIKDEDDVRFVFMDGDMERMFSPEYIISTTGRVYLRESKDPQVLFKMVLTTDDIRYAYLEKFGQYPDAIEISNYMKGIDWKHFYDVLEKKFREDLKKVL